jgi:hypothetical protein
LLASCWPHSPLPAPSQNTASMCAPKKKKNNGEKNKTQRWKTETGREREREREERESGQEREKPPGQERETIRAKRNIFWASERQTHQSADKWEREREKDSPGKCPGNGQLISKRLSPTRQRRSKFKPHKPTVCLYQQKQQQQLLRTHTTRRIPRSVIFPFRRNCRYLTHSCAFFCGRIIIRVVSSGDDYVSIELAVGVTDYYVESPPTALSPN